MQTRLQKLALFDSPPSPCRYAYATASVQSGLDIVHELTPLHKQLGHHHITVQADGLDADCIYSGMATDDSPLCVSDTATLFASPSRVTCDDDAQRLAQQVVDAL